MALTNAQRKTRIVNFALSSVGQKMITDIADGSVDANRATELLEEVILEQLDDDWAFSRERVNLQDMDKVFRIDINSSPDPAAWSVGATLTGATSGATATVKKVISSTAYWITEPSTDWEDGEVISDGTNLLDVAAGYPETDEVVHENWEYCYVTPTDELNFRFLADKYSDKRKYPRDRQGIFLFTNQTDAVYVYNKKIEESDGVADVTGFKMWFQRLISARMAFIMAPNVTENQRIQAKVDKEWDEAFLNAKEQNADETYNEHEDGDEDWGDAVTRELA